MSNQSPQLNITRAEIGLLDSIVNYYLTFSDFELEYQCDLEQSNKFLKLHYEELSLENTKIRAVCQFINHYSFDERDTLSLEDLSSLTKISSSLTLSTIIDVVKSSNDYYFEKWNKTFKKSLELTAQHPNKDFSSDIIETVKEIDETRKQTSALIDKLTAFEAEASLYQTQLNKKTTTAKKPK